jgi:hypothetical protein
LDPREVRSFTLREAVLAVKLELSGDDRVLSPTMHVKRGLRKDEGTGIRDTRVFQMSLRTSRYTSDGIGIFRSGSTEIGSIIRIGRTMPVSSEVSTAGVIKSTSVLEETSSINVGTRISSNGSRTSESMDSIRKSINGISVVERLGTKNSEKKSITS